MVSTRTGLDLYNNTMINTPKYIVIHCTDVSWKALRNQINSVEGSHKGRGFPLSSLGYHVGYHHLITGGIDYQTRRLYEVGAHCNQAENGKSVNTQSIGICVGFDGDVEYPHHEDYALLQKRVWGLQDELQIPNEDVRFHRHWAKDKTCPGTLCGEEWLKNLLRRSSEKPLAQEDKQRDILLQRISLLQRIISLYLNLKK